MNKPKTIYIPCERIFLLCGDNLEESTISAPDITPYDIKMTK